MAEVDEMPPPPPEEEEPPPPPDDDEEDKEDEEPPPPPRDRYADMTEDEAKGERLATLKERITNYALCETTTSTEDIVDQVEKMKLEPAVKAKALWGLVVFYHEYDSEGDEKADYLDAEWTDWSTPQVLTFIKNHGVEQKDEYGTKDFIDLVGKSVDAYISKAGNALAIVPDMLNRVNKKLKEKTSLGNNMAFRQTISL